MSALEAAIEAVLGRPMSFPDDYCVTFAAAIIAATHGVDILGNRFRSLAGTEAEAYADHPLGLAVTTARQLRALGFEQVAPQAAGVGCPVLLRIGAGYGHSLGVTTGTGWAVRRGPDGVVIHHLRDVIRAWSPPARENA